MDLQSIQKLPWVTFLVSLLASLPVLDQPAQAQFCAGPGLDLSTSDAVEGDAPLAVRNCDLNGDGAQDLVTANDASDTLSILINNGDGTYAPKVRFPVRLNAKVISEPVDVACCDVNGDGLADLICVNHTSDDLSVLLNLGSVAFAPPVHYAVGEAPFGIECLDVDNDDDADVITNGFTADAISVLLNNGAGVFASHVTYPAGDAPIAMAVCDVDGDGDQDVVTANMLGKSVSVLRNNADGTFTHTGSANLCSTPQNCVNPFDIVCRDLNGAGGPDVATANGIVDTVAVLFNNGSGGLGGYASYGGLDGAYALASGDVDLDGDHDIVCADLVSGSSGPDDLGVLVNNGSGVFAGPTFVDVGSDTTADPSSVIIVDLQGDPRPELICTFRDGLTVFENTCVTCGDAVCDAAEAPCGCPADCAAEFEAACDDGIDDDCDQAIDCADGDCISSPVCAGPNCGDGSCAPPENACSCPQDCAAPGAAVAPQADPLGVNKCRFLSLIPGNPGLCAALRVTLTSLHHVDPPYSGGPSPPFNGLEGEVRWAGPPRQYLESSSGVDWFSASMLGCTPYYHDWSAIPLLHVTGSAIVPSSQYEVEFVPSTCAGGEENCAEASPSLTVSTTRWGDVVVPFNPPDPTTQPNFSDVSALVDKFKSTLGAPIKARALLAGSDGFGNINIAPDLSFNHIAACVDAFRGMPYPFQVATCP